LGITFKYIYPGLLKTIFVMPKKRLQIIIDFGFIQIHTGYLSESTR